MTNTRTLTIGEDDIKGLLPCPLIIGHFSTIHPGHLRFFAHAKRLYGDNYVIAVTYESSTLEYIDQDQRIMPTELYSPTAILKLPKEGAYSLFKDFQPSALFLGNEYRSKNKTEVCKDLTIPESLIYR